MPASVLLGTGSLLAPSASTDPKASLDPRTAASPSALLSLCQPALVPVTSSRQPARAARLCTLWPPDTPYVWLAGCIKGHLCSLRDSTPKPGGNSGWFPGAQGTPCIQLMAVALSCPIFLWGPGGPGTLTPQLHTLDYGVAQPTGGPVSSPPAGAVF